MDNNFRKNKFKQHERDSTTIVNERFFICIGIYMDVFSISSYNGFSLLFALQTLTLEICYIILMKVVAQTGISIVGWICMLAPLGLVLVMNFAFNKRRFLL